MFRNPMKAKIPEPGELFDARKKRARRREEALPFNIRKRKLVSIVNTYPESDILALDEQTSRDLQLFDFEPNEPSLFDYCNHTKNLKGAEVLQARMLRPFASKARIVSVQESLKFILDHFNIFEELPAHADTNRVELYIHGTLPIAMSNNFIEFAYEVIDIRLGDSFRFYRITDGVEYTSVLIRKLRDFLSLTKALPVKGELLTILDEIKTLLSDPCFSRITEKHSWTLLPWKVLKIDQELRIYKVSAISRLLLLTYELDALISMAVTIRKNSLIIPSADNGPLSVTAKGIRHPLVQDCVANPIHMSQTSRFLFLTGPNMAGKTTYLRATGVSLYLAHLGMGVPAEEFAFTPAQAIFSSISLEDNLSKGVSYFRAEALRIKDIAQALAEGTSVFAILDEPFKGTNVKDALEASNEIMFRFCRQENCLFVFSSHLIEMETAAKKLDTIDYKYFEADENTQPLTFDYLLKSGVSSQRLGIRVLQEEGIFKLLDDKK